MVFIQISRVQTALWCGNIDLCQSLQTGRDVTPLHPCSMQMCKQSFCHQGRRRRCCILLWQYLLHLDHRTSSHENLSNHFDFHFQRNSADPSKCRRRCIDLRMWRSFQHWWLHKWKPESFSLREHLSPNPWLCHQTDLSAACPDRTPDEKNNQF